MPGEGADKPQPAAGGAAAGRRWQVTYLGVSALPWQARAALQPQVHTGGSGEEPGRAKKE